MKYNNTVEYKDLKLQERIRSGEYNLKVNGQQNKHILEHHDYRPEEVIYLRRRCSRVS